MNTLPSDTHKMTMQYGMSIFMKTRMSSHLRFVQKCLANSVIPNGFRVQPGVAPSSQHLRALTQRASNTLSKRLMRLQLRDFTLKFQRATVRIQESRDWMDICTLSESQIKALKSLVYRLNSDLFNHLTETKDKKFAVLCPPPASHTHSVVTIPEDLQIDDDLRSALAKGRKFVYV